MTNSFATISDLITLWRKVTPEEKRRAEELLPLVSNCLRAEADKVGRDLDQMIVEKPYMADVARSVTVDVTARMIMTSTNQEPMIQSAEAALGYSTSGTFLVPGGGLFIKKTELARLGLKRQRLGVIEFDTGHDS